MMTDAKPADPCSNCDGTGRTQGWPHTTCPTCKGRVTASEWDLDRAVCEKANQETYNGFDDVPDTVKFLKRARTRWPAALDALDEAKREIDRSRALHFQRTLDTAKIISERDRLSQRVAELEAELACEKSDHKQTIADARDEIDNALIPALKAAQKEAYQLRYGLPADHAVPPIGSWDSKIKYAFKLRDEALSELTHARAVVEAARMPQSDGGCASDHYDVPDCGTKGWRLCARCETAKRIQTYDDYMAKQGGGG